MIAVVALALLESVQAFSAPAMRAPTRGVSAVTMFSEGDLGVLPPLGVYDPLGLIETRNMYRYEVRAALTAARPRAAACRVDEPCSSVD
jgi:light-harvesting complex I chlorophyll a/b binding protein 1